MPPHLVPPQRMPDQLNPNQPQLCQPQPEEPRPQPSEPALQTSDTLALSETGWDGGSLIALGDHHLEACLALDRASLGGFWTLEQWRQELGQAQRPAVGLEREGQLVAMACAWLVLDELHITLVAVHPQQRRRGLGRWVLEALLERGHRLGAERATLEVAETNQAACRLYEGCGFRTAGIRRGYYRNGDNALIQWRSLPRPAGAEAPDPSP